jgi:hypothetical protein
MKRYWHLADTSRLAAKIKPLFSFVYKNEPFAFNPWPIAFSLKFLTPFRPSSSALGI